MNQLTSSRNERVTDVRHAQSSSSLVLICEHASPFIPKKFGNLGLADEDLSSHVVWDPGAMAVATHMSDRLNATLVSAKTSRLVYDCNRPPQAPDAIPERSEVVSVPGNVGLSNAERDARVAQYYHPFRKTVSEVVAGRTAPVIVTIHSFTPIYHGQSRKVEIGVLHDKDTRLADVLMAGGDIHRNHIVCRNEPYAAKDGVTHTLKEHALPFGYLNVMLEVRNDLIAREPAQAEMAEILARWLQQALTQLGVAACTS